MICWGTKFVIFLVARVAFWIQLPNGLNITRLLSEQSNNIKRQCDFISSHCYLSVDVAPTQRKVWKNFKNGSCFHTKFFENCLTPCPTGYGDATATYIRRAKIPLHTYTKHQHRQESEYGSTMLIYIPIIWYKYNAIMERDPILHEYYITRKYKNMIYKVIYRVQNW